MKPNYDSTDAKKSKGSVVIQQLKEDIEKAGKRRFLEKKDSSGPDRRICKVVESFNIPTSKDELIESILFFKSRKDQDECFEDKYIESMEIALQYYNGDPDFTRIIRDHAEWKKEQKKSNIISSILLCVGIIILVILLIVYKDVIASLI